MENLIKTAILDIRKNKKRPSMQEIYYTVKRTEDTIDMDVFKCVFDNLLDTNEIGKYENRDSYFVIDSYYDDCDINSMDLRSGIGRNFNTSFNEDNFVGQSENKFYQQDYVNELKSQIEFLKGEITHKNNIIFSLISKISNPITQIETMPYVNSQAVNNSKRYQAEDKYSPETKEVSPIQNTNDVLNKKVSNNNIDNTLKVEIIGDSLLNGLIDKGLSKAGNIKTRKYSGSTSSDIKHHIIPTIEKKPSVIIIHAATNDIPKDIDTIANYKSIIDKVIKQSPQTKLAISSLIIRKDKKDYDNRVATLNNDIKTLCEENLIDFIKHDNIDESCLGIKKLHLNKKGNSYFANNFINYVKSLS